MHLSPVSKWGLLTWKPKTGALFLDSVHVCPGTRGVRPEKCSGGVRSAFQNPYPIYDQNMQYSLPYLWPDQKFETLFMTWPLHQTCVTIVPLFRPILHYRKHSSWGLLLIFCSNIFLKTHPYKGYSTKTIPNLWQRRPKSAKIDTLFMTKTAEKPYPLGPPILVSPYRREYPLRLYWST